MGWRGGRNWFGAFVLIAVGVVGLVANFALLPRDLIYQLWKLWPLIPLIIGLRLLFLGSRWEDRPPHEAGKN